MTTVLILGISKSGGDPPPLHKFVGERLKILGDDFMIKFKLMKIANLISKLNFYKLIPYPMDNC